MTTLAIVANHEKKRLSLTGTVAAGEHVAVTLEDGWAWANAAGAALRLRVVFAGKLIAEFPRRDADPADTWSASGDDATCELNINSIPAAKYLRCGGDCIWVLDDPQLNTLYGVGELEVLPWRREPGGDVPYNLDGYPDLLDEFEEVKDAVSEFDTKKINKSAFISLLGKTLPDTATQKEVRQMVHDILELLKNAAVCAALAFALPAFGIDANTAWEDIPPQVKVKNVVEQFSPPADFSTNNAELVDTISKMAPVVGETDPTVPAWAKEGTKPEYTMEEIIDHDYIPSSWIMGAPWLSRSGGTLTGSITMDATGKMFTIKKGSMMFWPGTWLFFSTGSPLTISYDDLRIWDDEHGTNYYDGVWYEKIDERILRLASSLNTASNLAPDFTAKEYADNELCVYNGVVYRCKDSYTATALSDTPDVDTTHWEAKKVSEIFLPRTGGTITGSLKFGEKHALSEDVGGSILVKVGGSWEYIELPTRGGELALVSDIGVSEYSDSRRYSVGMRVVYSNAIWTCIREIEIPAGWSGTNNWTRLFDLSTDATPTANSTALMKSGDIKTALDTRVGRSEALTDGFTVFTTTTINGYAGNFRYYPTETTNVWALYARDNNGVYQPIGAGGLFPVCRLVWVASVAQWRAGSSVEAASSSSMRDEEAGFDAASIVISSGSTTVFTLTRETTPVALKIDLAEKASLDSPTFTGSPTAPTAASGDNSTKLATTAFVQAAVGSSSGNPLSGQSFDFATMQGVFVGVKACIEALGGSVTNFPANN